MSTTAASAYERRWTAGFNALKSYVDEHGALPARSRNPELSVWLRNQRTSIKRGQLSDDRRRLLATIPGAAEFRTPNIDRLAEFVAAEGRLPRITAGEPLEHAMARYLIYSLRPTIRNGTIGARTLAVAKTIPGAMDIRRVKDQDTVMEELLAYTAEHGHLPPAGGRGTAQEARLSVWLNNNLAGDLKAKSPMRRARHERLQQLVGTIPAKRVAMNHDRIAELESFCTDRGHLPTMSGTGTDQERSLCRWLAVRRTALAEGGLDAVTARRLKRILKYPTKADFDWQATFNALTIYAGSHAGRLPRNWSDGRLFSWLTGQRREFREGTMPAWRLELLQGVDGALPGRHRGADAA